MKREEQSAQRSGEQSSSNSESKVDVHEKMILVGEIAQISILKFETHKEID